jgi:hypothetical protein
MGGGVIAKRQERRTGRGRLGFVSEVSRLFLLYIWYIERPRFLKSSDQNMRIWVEYN